MKTLLSNFVIFATGASIGAAVTWKLLKTKYERLVQEEIESYKDAMDRLNVKEYEGDNGYEAPAAEIVTNKNEYSNIIETSNYKGVKNMNEPYVISPEAFGENDDYDTETLYYFQDGVLTDDQDMPIEDVDSIVGKDSLNHFGEYEDDSVFVRNEGTKTDYEILLEPRAYSDATNFDPHLAEEE